MRSIRLNLQSRLTVRPKPPFHFDGTFRKPSHFPNELALERWEPGQYWQPIRIGRRIYGLKIENRGSVGRPKLALTAFSSAKLQADELRRIRDEIAYRFEFNADLAPFIKATKADRRFAPVFRKWLGMRSASQFTLYELLVIGLVLQNATVRRSQQMLDALVRRYGTATDFDGRRLYAIWLPERLRKVSETGLRNLKIGYRAKFLKRLSEEFADGFVNEARLRRLDAETVKAELTKLYGVGPETARILLFEVFHRYDVFDHIAPWQQKIYSRLFYGRASVPTARIRNDIVKRYGSYSMLAVHYIWEDIFWRRDHEHIPWLEREIRR